MGARTEAAWSLGFRGRVVSARGEHERAESLLNEALALFRELDDKAGLAWVFASAGEVAVNLGDYERARMLLEDGLALYRELGNQAGAAHTRWRLVAVEREQGNHQQARALLQEVLVWAHERGVSTLVSRALGGLAGLHVIAGQPERVGRLFGAMETIIERTGSSRRDISFMKDSDIAIVREQLDPATFDALWAEGRAMSPQEAIDYALEEVGEQADE